MAVMHTVIMAAQFNGPNGYELTQTSLNALARPVRSCEVNVMLILFHATSGSYQWSVQLPGLMAV